MGLVKQLGVIVAILLLYNLVVGIVWHQIGYQGSQFGVLFGIITVGVSKIGFPILFVTAVYRRRPKTASGWWNVGAYAVCLVPLLMSTLVEHVVYTHGTGYYHAMMTSTMAGAGEGIAVRQFLVLVQWIWLTLFLSLFMAWKSWMIRTYG